MTTECPADRTICMERLARIEQAMKDGRENTSHERRAVADALSDLAAVVRAQNGRIGKLENWRSWMLGGMAVLSIVIPIIWGIVLRAGS